MKTIRTLQGAIGALALVGAAPTFGQTQACCYPNGVCADLAPATCLSTGGSPQGVGTTCTLTPCPLLVEACCLPGGGCVDTDVATCLSIGGLPQGPGTTCVTSNCFCPTNPRYEFSVDIGGDVALSDPFLDGDEVLDPGDIYLQSATPFAGPTNGFRDDAAIFGLDLPPTPFGGFLPVCLGGGIGLYTQAFDLDAHDMLDVDLRTVITADGAIPQPISIDSACIYRPQFMAMSFDDDQGTGWVGAGPVCDVPGTVLSINALRYGTTACQDELMTLALGAGGFPPFAVVGQGPLASERQVHASLVPDPNGPEADDDDVDSLDLQGANACPFMYFSPDHEGTGFNPLTGAPLDPGSVYLNLGGAVAPIIDDVVHLGVPESTDIDAFEFAYLPTPSGATGLALIFSVDQDDPLTPVNESGGLNPGMLYYSFFRSASFPLLTQPFLEDVDALSIWCAPVPQQTPCPGDADGNQAVDFADLNLILLNWGVPVVPGTNGDVSCDGIVNFGDLNILLINWGATCP